MTKRDDELSRWLAGEHAKNQEMLRPLLESPRPPLASRSAAWDEWLQNHERVAEAIATLHKARSRRRRKA